MVDAGTVQAIEFTITEQAPQLPVSQPTCVPFIPSVSRMKCTSSCRDSTVACVFSPLIVNSIACTVPASTMASSLP